MNRVMLKGTIFHQKYTPIMLGGEKYAVLGMYVSNEWKKQKLPEQVYKLNLKLALNSKWFEYWNDNMQPGANFATVEGALWGHSSGLIIKVSSLEIEE